MKPPISTFNDGGVPKGSKLEPTLRMAQRDGRAETIWRIRSLSLRFTHSCMSATPSPFSAEESRGFRAWANVNRLRDWLLLGRPFHESGFLTPASRLDRGHERLVGHFPDKTFGRVPGRTRSTFAGRYRLPMSIAQRAPGLDRSREHGARSVFGCDIWFDWPRFGDRHCGAVESCDRPVNGVELIRQFPTFLCKQASYLIRFDHCHPEAAL